jgi:Flp pilus assembly pilin Flp
MDTMARNRHVHRRTSAARFVSDEDGQGLAEYALIVGFVALALVVVIGIMTSALSNFFNLVVNAFAGA